MVVGDNPRLDGDAWKRRADLYNQCGKLALDAGMQFCYHAHFNEFARIEWHLGYDIMLTKLRSKTPENGNGCLLGHLRRS